MNASKQIGQGFLIIIFLIWISRSHGQQYFENPIVLKDAQVGSVTDAVVDNNGFLWIAGTGGLNRYDGHQHKYFRHDSTDSLSIFSNEINDLFYDEQQNELWIATEHTDKCGIIKIDLKTEHIENILLDPKGLLGLGGRAVDWICKDRLGGYWISIRTIGLVNYLPGQDSIIPVRYHALEKETTVDGAISNTIYSYSFDMLNDSLMWIGTREGLLKFNVVTHQFIRYPINERPRDGYQVRCLLHHSDNQVYAGTWSNGLYRFDPEKEQFSEIEIDTFSYNPAGYKTAIRGLVAKSSSHLWVTTNAGLMEYDLIENKVIPFKFNDYTKEIYSGVYQVDQKNRALYWIFNSIYLFDPLRQQNKVYSHEAKNQKDVKGFIVRRILEDENTGKIWIAAQYSEGLYRLDLQSNKWEIFPPPKSSFKEKEEVHIWDVLRTKRGEVLALLSLEGIYKASEQEKKLVLWDLQPDIEGITTRRMIEDTGGNIWLGGDYEGVFKIDPKTKTIRKFKNELYPPDSLVTGWIKDLQEDRNGNIWICSRGCSVYDVSRDSIFNFPYFLPDKKTFYDTYGLGIDGAGNVLVGSHEKGIGITDADHPEKGIVAYIDKGNGLKSSGSYRLMLDQKRNVWSLSGGFAKINPEREVVQHFDYNYFSFNELWSMGQLANGNIALGHRKGISIFNPDSLRTNQTLTQPYVMSFKVFDEERKLISSPFQKTDVYLKPYENFFSMEFSALNPIFFGKTQMRYQLDGIDPDWVDPKNRRYVSYTNIPGGNYNFKLRAMNNEGLWNETPYVFRIHIAIPWYRTWWAYLSYALLFFGTLYFWYRFRLNRRLEKLEALRLQELDTFKTRFYANITHEFRTPLTVIEGMANELENNPDQVTKKNLGLIRKNSKNLLALVNQMLDLSKLKAGKVNLDFHQSDIILFVKYLVETHESFAKLQNVGLQFYSDETELLMDFDPKKVEQVLTNLISNALKFTPEYGKVLVVAKKINQHNQPHLQILIKDNGIGISREQLPYIFDRFHQANPTHENQGTGIGLALVKELMAIMDGSISVESEPDKGTTFFLEFPIQNKAPLVSQTNQFEFKALSPQEDLTKKEVVLKDNEFPILLIIEDNADVTYYLQTCLEDQYQILTSRNGKEGIDKAFETLPDIIISDVMMPVMDGFEVCTILKNDDRTSHIPIILLTAKATSEDKLLGLAQGADAYLIKPFEKAELIVRLNKLLEIRETLQKKYSSTLMSSQSKMDGLENKVDTYIDKVEKIILAHLEDEDFSIHQLGQELHLSRSQAHRKIKALTGMSTGIYIRHIRLQKAKELLASTQLSISEIAYRVGFKTPLYFSQVFKETFGKSPNATRK